MLLAGTGGLPLGAGQHHRVQPGAVDTDRTRRHGARRGLPAAVRHPRGAVRRTGRGQARAGCAVSARTGCTCPPVWWGRTGAYADGHQLDAAGRRRGGTPRPSPTRCKTIFPRRVGIAQLAAGPAGAHGSAAGDCWWRQRSRSWRGPRTAAPVAPPVSRHTGGLVQPGPSSRPVHQRVRIVLVATRDCRAPRAADRTTASTITRTGGLTAGQYIVADGHLFDPHPPCRVIGHPLVDALVASAREHQMLPRCSTVARWPG